ncbi:MlaD family protein [Parahaliea aestuarii]|uniref:MCE family protein n=1 Tax=Parahaliea aestuarii TaxID=1852021 RepID=A0A5C8ZPV0_9GAMM|nr:MlaD family protein [Parahaliea aestuarii]TXS89719.1 MCE family protein [Parahaliea aestuarii]
MSENSHSVAIGAFILGALLIAVTTIIFIVGSGIGSGHERVVMVFDGSVKGLSVGAPVALRGVQIGQVTHINLILDSDNDELIMLVEADLDADNVQKRGSNPQELTEMLIERGMRAQLNTQSLLTGLLYVQLDFHPDTVIELPEIDSPYLQIPTIPTNLEKLSRQIDEIDFAQVASDLSDIATGLKSVITDEKFQTLPGEVNATFHSITALSEDIRSTLGRLEPGVNQLLANANNTLGTVDDNLPRLVTLVEEKLAVVESTLQNFDQTLKGVDNLIAEDSPTTYELNRALTELAEAGRALQLLAKTLEEQPEALLRGKNEDAP